jgi:uncharacterized protein (TIGR00369 family)
MDLTALFEQVPFVDHLGIKFVTVEAGHAEARMDLRPELSSNPSSLIAHGGVTFALADTVGGAAVVSEYAKVCPTIDMRIDYLAPATDDLYACADVQRGGDSVAVVDVAVYDTEKQATQVASARGVYKTGGQGDDTPWTDGTDADATDLTEPAADATDVE